VSRVSTPVTPLPPGIRQALQTARVVLCVSPLTDARPVTRWLRRQGLDYQLVELSMSSALSRDEFRQLQAATGWPSLPQIFIDGVFVGGIEEFFAHPVVAWAMEPESPARVRRTAQWLGYLGAVPFGVCALAAVLARGEAQTLALQALVGYGAVILSFVGALHWTRGLEAATDGSGTRALAISVLPALLAWVGLLLPFLPGMFLLAAGFALLFLYDRRMWHEKPWFLRLRLRLSAVAVICLGAGATNTGWLL
jgi:glutaredoxin-related protein